MLEIRYNSRLHLLAVLTACATFPLIFMGGLVTSQGAGMSVPDWPNSYGYNMFLFPPNQWMGGILYEHTHRLMGTVVGFCSILLVLFAWGPARSDAARRRLRLAAAVSLLLTPICALAPFTYNNNQTLTDNLRHAAVGFGSLFLILVVACMARSREERRSVRWLSVLVLGMVIFQGVLGGLRVVLVKLDLAIVHACFAQAFFCLTALMAMVTSRWWIEAAPVANWRSRLAVLGLIATATIYVQLILGAVMRHNDAGLAIPDFPASYGKVLPPTNAAELKAVNDWRAWNSEQALNSRVTLAQVWLHFAHRAWAVVVAIMVILFVIAATRHGSELVHRPASVLAILLLVQFALGILTVLTRKPADLATAHVAVGALVLVSTFTITIRAMRLGHHQTESQPDHLIPEGHPALL
jgi:cytochrome c oxidase assembly protein subunit 15